MVDQNGVPVDGSPLEVAGAFPALHPVLHLLRDLVEFVAGEGQIDAQSLLEAFAAVAADSFELGVEASRDYLCDIGGAAEMLGVSPARVRALAASREVGFKVGSSWLFSPADLHAMRDRQSGRRPAESAAAPAAENVKQILPGGGS